MAYDTKKRSFGEWVNDKKDEKYKREALKILKPRLEKASFFYQSSMELIKRGTPADYKDAIECLLRACEIYELSTQYTVDYYINLFGCQRFLSGVYHSIGQYESAYEMTSKAIQTLTTIVDNQLAKPHQYVEYFCVFYEHASNCVTVKNMNEAIICFLDYINKEEKMLGYYPEELERGIADCICDSIGQLYSLSLDYKIVNVDFDNVYTSAYKSLICDGFEFLKEASDVANLYAMHMLRDDTNRFQKVTTLLVENYRNVKRMVDTNNLYDKAYYDMAITSCNLERLFRLSNNIDYADNMSAVTRFYLPKAIDSFKENNCRYTHVGANDVYEYIIKYLKQDYVPRLSPDKKQNAIKVLKDCENKVQQAEFKDEYDFDI